MTDELPVDRHLHAVYDGLVEAIYLTKQGTWAVSAPERRERLRDLLEFLIERSHAVDEAESRVDGRAAEMRAPSSHPRRNLLGEAGNDMEKARTLFMSHLVELVQDIRRRATAVGAAPESELLRGIADGLEMRRAALDTPE
jgi:hypothetical protein